MLFLKNLCFLVVYVISYWVGFFMYNQALWAFWKQSLGGESNAVLFWSAFAYIPIGLIYLLICVVIKDKMKQLVLRNLLYPICCALVFVIPTTFIIVINGGGSFFSPEAQLFNVLFVSTGVSFGLGYSLVTKLFENR